MFIRLVLVLLLACIAVSADELTCNTLRNTNQQLLGLFGDTSCSCTASAEAVTDTCSACIESTSGDSYKGIAKATISKSTEGPTYNQQTTVNYCFQYGSDLYNGAQVCFVTSMSGTQQLYGNSACEVKVDGRSCAACQTFTVTELAFDCSNIEYKSIDGNMTKFEAVNNSTEFNTAASGSLLRFMDDSQVKATTGCPVTGGSGDGGGSGGTSTSVSRRSAIVLYGTLSFGILGFLA